MTDHAPLHTNRARADSFGDDAEQYDRARPPYPPELIDELLVGRPHTVLDVGCGTGIASRLFMAQGCEVLGLEPDPRMAAVARRHGVSVEEGSVEEWESGGRRFDLLTSGQAWHWVDPQRGASKAAEVLRPGGRIGLFWNQAFPSGDVREAMLGAYEHYAPVLGQESVLIGQRKGLYESIAHLFRAHPSFTDVTVQTFAHHIAYPTELWLELAMTHSDHRTLPPADLARLLDALREAIDRSGGQVPVRYEATLIAGRTISNDPI
jgi:SAM-dependent methyltransferase